MTSDAVLRSIAPASVGPSVDPGPVPTLSWIEIDRLRIDDSYQRPITQEGWKRIESISARFAWSCFSPCLVAPVGDGLFAIIDGQHRCHAAAAIGQLTVPCQVVDLGPVAQAAAFAAVNGDVTSVTVFDILKAALVAGAPWAVELQGHVEASGARLMTYPVPIAKRRPGQVFAIGLLRRYVEAGRGARVRLVLSGIQASERSGSVFHWSSAVLPALLVAVDQFPDTTASEFSAFLTDEDLSAVYEYGIPRLRKIAIYAKDSRTKLFERLVCGLFSKWRRINVEA